MVWAQNQKDNEWGRGVHWQGCGCAMTRSYRMVGVSGILHDPGTHLYLVMVQVLENPVTGLEQVCMHLELELEQEYMPRDVGALFRRIRGRMTV